MAQYRQLDRQIIELLDHEHPQSIRHVFYRMTNSHQPVFVVKKKKGYRCVQDRISLLRKDGRIPYGHIVDMSRAGWRRPLYSSPREYLLSELYSYRHNLWAPTGRRCEVWCESQSLASVIWPTCRKWGVACFPTQGHASESFVYDAAETHGDAEWSLVAFYIGDLDPSGLDAYYSLRRKLTQHMRVPWEMHHLGINHDQVERYDLPGQEITNTNELKKGLRYDGMTMGWEGESMPSEILRGIVETEIASLLPENALAVAREEEESARAVLRSLAEMG